MKTLYIDCGMGAAGDMLSAALTELLPDPDAFVKKLNALGIPGVEFHKETAVKCGITGTHMRVLVHGQEEGEHLHDHHHHEHTHEHHHDHGHDDHDHEHTHDHGHVHGQSMHTIRHLVLDHLQLDKEVAKHVLAVYDLIAEAESHVHGKPVEEIHFHEVGTMDALADITAVCLLMQELSVEKVIASPVHVGSGQVTCAHGILPVPAPATAYILRDVPICSGQIKGELCTPTGAALLKHFVTAFDAMPVMKVQKIGYGMGTKDFEAANCVRVMLGETEGSTDSVLRLSCNIDDMSAEDIGYATAKLLEEGALDVYTVNAGMKKNRPGTILTALIREEEREKFLSLLFRLTTTIGVREERIRRHVLERRMENIDSPYGVFRVKISEGYGIRREKIEYEDLVKIASERGISTEEARRLLTGELSK